MAFEQNWYPQLILCVISGLKFCKFLASNMPTSFSKIHIPTNMFIPSNMIIELGTMLLPTCLFHPTLLFGTLEYSLVKEYLQKKLLFLFAKESLYTGEPMRQQKNLVISGCRIEFDYVSRQRIHQKFLLQKLKKSKYSQPAFLNLNIKK